MFPLLNRTLRALPIAGLFAAGLCGQAQTPTPASEPAFVMNKEFRSRMFVLKHQDPQDLIRSLRGLGSGFKGAEVIANKDLGTLSVRDFPENIAIIEEAINRLDVLRPVRREIEFHIHVLFASNLPGTEGSYPEELREVLTALKSTLNYRSYTLGASILQRAKEGSQWIKGAGATEIQTTEAKGEKHTVTLPFKFEISALSVENTASAPSVIKLEGMDFGFSSVPPEWAARIRTDLSIKDGEKVVVGTSTLKDRGVVVVITANLLK